jgi:hypothetical protein
MAGLHVLEPEAHWTTVCEQYTTVAARLAMATLVRDKKIGLLTIQVELHVGLRTRVETVFARVLAETRLSGLFSRQVDVEINWCVEIRDRAVVDVEEIGVEKHGVLLL